MARTNGRLCEQWLRWDCCSPRQHSRIVGRHVTWHNLEYVETRNPTHFIEFASYSGPFFEMDWQSVRCYPPCTERRMEIMISKKIRSCSFERALVNSGHVICADNYFKAKSCVLRLFHATDSCQTIYDPRHSPTSASLLSLLTPFAMLNQYSTFTNVGTVILLYLCYTAI